MRTHKITTLPGDGIGPEITTEALKVLQAAGQRFGFQIDSQSAPVGGAAIDAEGVPLSDATIESCKRSDAVLLGAVGGPKWDSVPAALRPEQGLLKLRKSLGLFCNLRPIKLYEPLKNKSPLKDRLTSKGIDMMFVRELTGGIYFGERGLRDEDTNPTAWDVETYSTSEISRISAIALELASQRSGRLTSVDKANVLESSRLWRKTVSGMAEQFESAADQIISLNHMYVDNCAMQLIIDPSQFDVILTSNLFGDILSDEASALGGSIGLMPSASLGAATQLAHKGDNPMKTNTAIFEQYKHTPAAPNEAVVQPAERLTSGDHLMSGMTIGGSYLDTGMIRDDDFCFYGDDLCQE